MVGKKEKKELYQLNIYKLQKDTLENYKSKIADSVREDELKRIVTNNIDEENKVLYISYTVETKNEGIKWFRKWQEFFPTIKDKTMRGGSKTGHGLLLCDLDKQIFAIVFGRSFALIKDYIDDEYGMDMAEKLLEENTIKTKASKHFNLTKNKSIVDYNGNQYSSFEESEAADLFSAKIKEHVEKKYTAENYITQILEYMTPDITISYANIKVTASNKKIELTTVKKILSLLMKIEKTYKAVFEFPRFNPVPKKLITTLNAELLKKIRKDENQYIDFAIPFYTKDNSDNYIFLHNIENIKITHNHKPLWEENSFLGFNLKEKVEQEGITDLTKVNVKTAAGTAYDNGDILKWLDTDLEYNDKQYTLNNGKWVTFNKNYIKKINDKIKKLPTELSVVNANFNISKSDLEKHYTHNKKEIEKLAEKPYRELKYNHKLSTDEKDDNYLFDRVLFNGIEVCDIYQPKEKTLLHVKFGDTGAFEACLRQSLIGAKYYHDNTDEISKKENLAKQKIGEVSHVKVLFLATNDYNIKKTRSIRFKQTLISWYNTVKEMKFEPQIIIAKFTDNE